MKLKVNTELTLFIFLSFLPSKLAHTAENPSPNLGRSCCGVDNDIVRIQKEGQEDTRTDCKEHESAGRKCGNIKSPVESKYSREKSTPLVNKFILIKGGGFFVGTDKPFIPQDGEAPARKVYIDDFYINEFEVSNEEFLMFFQETQYVTEVKGLYIMHPYFRGGARNFPTGADSSDEGAKIWFSGCYKCHKSPKKSLFTCRRGASMLRRGGHIPLALPWRHPSQTSIVICNQYIGCKHFT